MTRRARRAVAKVIPEVAQLGAGRRGRLPVLDDVGRQVDRGKRRESRSEQRTRKGDHRFRLPENDAATRQRLGVSRSGSLIGLEMHLRWP